MVNVEGGGVATECVPADAVGVSREGEVGEGGEKASV